MTIIEDRLKTYAEFFETLSVEDLGRFDQIFSKDIHFKDPFNDVYGIEAVKQVFTHMFEQCNDPRFCVSDYCGTKDCGYLYWTFQFNPKKHGHERNLEGLSRVIFNSAGQVCEHVDYWDPAEQIYSDLPVLGWILKRIRRRLSAAKIKKHQIELRNPRLSG